MPHVLASKEAPAIKDGKEHRYWSIVESCRNLDGRVVRRQVSLSRRNQRSARKPHGPPNHRPGAANRFQPGEADGAVSRGPTRPGSLECVKWCRSSLNELYGSIIRVSGARVGWRSRCGSSWSSTNFGMTDCPASRQVGTKWLEVLKTRGVLSSSSTPAVNGVCIATGMHIAPCATCWAVRFACQVNA